MTTATHGRDRRLIYNHARSKEARAPERQDPVATLRGKHHAELAGLGTRHKREGDRLEIEFNGETARSKYRDRPVDEGKRRKALQEKHRAERTKMQKRHGVEVETEFARHPVD